MAGDDPTSADQRSLSEEARHQLTALWSRDRTPVVALALLACFGVALQHLQLLHANALTDGLQLLVSMLLWIWIFGVTTKAVFEVPNPWRLDRSFWQYASAQLLILALLLPGYVSMFVVTVVSGPSGLKLLAQLLLLVIALIVFIGFCVWPVGRLVDDAMTLGGAWRRTRGMTLRVIGAYLRVQLPAFLILIVATLLRRNLPVSLSHIAALTFEAAAAVYISVFSATITPALYLLTRDRG